MQPSRSLWEEVSGLLAADVATLAAAVAMHVHLVKASFVPSLNLVLADVVLATFTGSTAKNAGTGAQPVFYDPLTGLRVIEILAPAGGWHWTCTATPSPAETIYGWVLTDNADAVVLGSELLPTPVPISLAGQGLDLTAIRLSFSLSSPA